METVIWLVGIALPVAALLYLFGWLVGFNAGCNMSNWGTGYDDGWKAYKELVTDARRTDNGLISRKDAVSRISDLLILELKGQRVPTWNEVYNAIGDIPSVPAVPLDKLCEWLDEYMTAPGVDVYEVPKNHQKN